MPLRLRLPLAALAAALVLAAAPVPAQSPRSWADGGPAPELAPVFAGSRATLVVVHGRTGREVRWNRERSRRRFTPFSTFKVPNSLIALETGVLSGPDHLIRWDSIRDPRQGGGFPAWWRDHDLRSAMRSSVVWYYREVARRVGPERMRAQLARIGYGNGDISGGIDRFWLGSTLRISAEEQVRFLRRFHAGRLGFSPRATAVVKDVLVTEAGPGWTLKAKTGGGPLGEDALGWWVGYVERGGETYFFALNVDGESYDAIAGRRTELARAALRRLGVLPAA